MTEIATALEVTELPDPEQLIPCQLSRQDGTGALCGATPVTHELRFRCPSSCPPRRAFCCAPCAVKAQSYYAGGRGLDQRCGQIGDVVLLPLAGAL